MRRACRKKIHALDYVSHGLSASIDTEDRRKDRVPMIGERILATERTSKNRTNVYRERERERERMIGIKEGKGRRDERERDGFVHTYGMVYDATGQLLPIYTRIAAAIKFYGRASRERETPVSNALSASRKAG